MEFVENSAIKIRPKSYTDINDLYEFLEKCGRICYRSQKREGTSSVRFVEGLIDSGHWSVLEHAPVYLDVDVSWKNDNYQIAEGIVDFYRKNKYSRVVIEDKGGLYTKEYTAHISTTLRVIEEGSGRRKDLKYMCEPTSKHILRHSFLMTTCIQVYKELTRHRRMSFSIESTRYCNYNRKGLRVLDVSPFMDGIRLKIFKAHLRMTSICYSLLIKLGVPVEMAAGLLPQVTAADMVMSGYENDWIHVLKQRLYGITGKPHRLVKQLMEQVQEQLHD